MMRRPFVKISILRPIPIQPTLSSVPPQLEPSMRAGVGSGKNVPPQTIAAVPSVMRIR
jgi:hypothetical protein